MSLKNQLNPPKPPKSLGNTSSKKGFFTKMLFSLGLKHEHIEDFDALVQLKQEKVDSKDDLIIDKALNYKAFDTKKISDINKDVSIAINGVKQENKDISFDVQEKPKQKTSKKTNFLQDTSTLDSGNRGHFSQDTEYTFKKSLDEKFSSFHDDSKIDNKSSWIESEDKDIEGQNNLSHTSEKIDFAKPENNSLFTKEIEGESI